MKKLLGLLSILYVTIGFSQVTLEHTYDASDLQMFHANDGTLNYFVVNDKMMEITVYNSNHSLIQTTDISPVFGDSTVGDANYDGSDTLYPPKHIGAFFFIDVQYAADKLMDSDDGFEFIITGRKWYDTLSTNQWPTPGYSNYQYTSRVDVLIVDDNGSLLFERTDGNIHDGYTDEVLFNDNGTWKFIISYYVNYVPGFEVYSFPGTSHEVGIVEPVLPQIKTNAFPNPALEYTKVAYELPTKLSSATMVIYNEVGLEIERLDVGTAFSDVLINTSTYNAGTYIYQMMSPQGALSMGKFVVMK